MPINPTQQSGSELAALLQTSPDKYISLGDLLKYNKPDNRDLLIQTFGDQGITGFLELTGAVKSGGTADEVQYWEEGRLHKTITHSGVAGGSGARVMTVVGEGNTHCRLNDVLLLEDGQRVVVTALASTQVTVKRLDGASVVAISGTGLTATIIGNIYAQGTNQPSAFYNTDVKKRINPYFITKETFSVNGSQATNIGWINVGNGDYRWYVKGEMDTRKRFMNQREMMMLLSQVVTDTSTPDVDNISLAGGGLVTGSEGYFDAIQDRGITASGSFDTMSDIDSIILLLDRQGAPSEYALYVDTATSLNLDDMLAQGIATSMTAGLPGQFGAFQNSPDLAVQLGFKSFTRGGYTFHKHSWKLLNDPTLLGAWSAPGSYAAPFKGVMTPMSQVADAKTGVKSPSLEMNYKEANGYSRELEHWVTGGGVLGYKTDGVDTAQFNYRSECNLITRAANQHVLLTA
jgi:hypothetical protein